MQKKKKKKKKKKEKKDMKNKEGKWLFFTKVDECLG